MGVLVIVFFVLVFIAIAVVSAKAEAKKREQMAQLARQLGLRFCPEKDHEPARKYAFLQELNTGSNRYAFHVFSGMYRDAPVEAFDYHYETYSTDFKGRRRTDHHYLSLFVLTLPRSFPELTIAKEGLLSKIAQAVGYDDIDFESHEFSRRFVVRSKDKKFAYDFCNAQMIDYLLQHQGLQIEVDRDTLALVFHRVLDVETIQYELDRLLCIRTLMPNYLFD